MESIDKKMKESSQKLDSYILEYKENAEKIKTDEFKLLMGASCLRYNKKRTKDTIEYPDVKTIKKINKIKELLKECCFLDNVIHKENFIQILNETHPNLIKSKFVEKQFIVWFTPLDSILEKIKSINKDSDYLIMPYESFKLILYYTSSKLSSIISEIYSNNRRTSTTIYLMQNYERNKSNRTLSGNNINEKKVDLIYEMTLKSMDDLIREYDLKISPIKLYNKVHKGKTESIFLKKLYDDLVTPKSGLNRNSLAKKRTVFELFSLVVKDFRIHLNEDEFLKDKNTETFRNYNRYKEHVIQKILERK